MDSRDKSRGWLRGLPGRLEGRGQGRAKLSEDTERLLPAGSWGKALGSGEKGQYLCLQRAGEGIPDGGNSRGRSSRWQEEWVLRGPGQEPVQTAAPLPGQDCRPLWALPASCPGTLLVLVPPGSLCLLACLAGGLRGCPWASVSRYSRTAVSSPRGSIVRPKTPDPAPFQGNHVWGLAQSPSPLGPKVLEPYLLRETRPVNETPVPGGQEWPPPGGHHLKATGPASHGWSVDPGPSLRRHCRGRLRTDSITPLALSSLNLRH